MTGLQREGPKRRWSRQPLSSTLCQSLVIVTMESMCRCKSRWLILPLVTAASALLRAQPCPEFNALPPVLAGALGALAVGDLNADGIPDFPESAPIAGDLTNEWRGGLLSPAGTVN